LILTLVSSSLAITSCEKPTSQDNPQKINYIHNEGETQGTYYSATYLQPEGIDLRDKIEARLHKFDLSLSIYDSTSIISRINRNENVETDSCFEIMFNIAREVSEKTEGAFDITVGPLVKAWGFAFGNNDHNKMPDIHKLLPYIGYKKIRLENNKLLKESPEILIDANALAQGLSADVISQLLQNNGCEHYMIEIGGEIVCKGMNPKGKKWRIGIDKPIDGSTRMQNTLQAVVSITNMAITTSGNYRKFYIKDGKKYAHTIDPKTGTPVQHNLLSATVIAPSCVMADAYATAFMVLGVEKSLKICESIQGMDCYLISVNKDGNYQISQTKGFKKYLAEE
jgi:thiamine biosynthesis lipoprotein